MDGNKVRVYEIAGRFFRGIPQAAVYLNGGSWCMLPSLRQRGEIGFP